MRRDFAVMCGLTVHFESCKRNKKCLIAYLQHRLYKIRALRWETGRVVPENLRHTISRREHDYYDGYDTLLVNYMESVGDNLTAVRVCPFADDNLMLWRELALPLVHPNLYLPHTLSSSYLPLSLSLSLLCITCSGAPPAPPDATTTTTTTGHETAEGAFFAGAGARRLRRGRDGERLCYIEPKYNALSPTIGRGALNQAGDA